MKNLYVIFCFTILFSFTGDLFAQTKETVPKDSIVSDKNNLLLFIERTYLASKAYQTGVYNFYKDIEKPKKDTIEQLRTDSIWKGGHIDVSLSIIERPIRVAVIKKGERVIMRGEELNRIPIDSIASIEIIYGALAPALYGVDGSGGGMVIKLK